MKRAAWAARGAGSAVLLGLALLACASGGEAVSPGGPDAAIDWHALQAPTEVEQSVETLAAYLVAPAKNDREKARALYTWVCDRISYDAAGFFSGRYGDNSVEGVLRSRVSVCAGYARLFAALAQAAGLEAEIVTGWAKGYGYRMGDPLPAEPNHDWNAVKLEGQWRLLDCAWGAGHLNRAGQFVREFDEFHFLTPPEQKIYRYFPQDPRWQLLPQPLTQEEFAGLPFAQSSFFGLGLELDSHPSGVIQTGSEVQITLRGGPDAKLMASVIIGQQELDRRYTFVQWNGSAHEIRAYLPRPGSYTLRVYARPPGAEERRYTSALEYQVQAGSGAGENALFPRTYGTFNDTGAALLTPLKGRLPGGSRQEFRLRVPGAEKVLVVNGRQRTALTPQGGVFTGQVELRRGQAEIYAGRPGEDTVWALLSYDVY